MEKERTYIITLDEDQYQDVITAVEIFHRVACGQVEELRNIGGGFKKLTDETLCAQTYEAAAEDGIQAACKYLIEHKEEQI